MRRTTAAVVGTLAGTALLTGLKLGMGGGGAGAMTGDNTAAGQGGDLGQAPAPATTSQQPAAGTGHHKKKTTHHTGTGMAAGRANASGLKDGTYLGKSVTDPYGHVRVSITVSGGKITAVHASYPTGGESTTVNSHAIPILKRETLTAQSAHIDSVSGATYTSPAFRESLQSALNAAHG